MIHLTWWLFKPLNATDCVDSFTASVEAALNTSLTGPALTLLPEVRPNVTTTYMAGQNHLIPLERPDLVAPEIAHAFEAWS